MVTDLEICTARALSDVENEVAAARLRHAPMQSVHEAYAVLLEEVDEFWAEVKKKREQRDRAKMRDELTQVAAMAVRAIGDLGL